MKIWKICIESFSAFAGILLMILMEINTFLLQDEFLNYTNEKYAIANKIRISQSDLENAVHAMVSYVKWEADTPQVTVKIEGKTVPFFNKKEIEHLEDIRMLIGRIYIIMAILSVVFLFGMIYLIRKKEWGMISKGIYGAWKVLGVSFFLVGMICVIDIDLFINIFHQIFLGNSNWVLNPSFDRSVWMFFSDMYIDVVFVLAIIIFKTFLISIIALYVTKGIEK